MNQWVRNLLILLVLQLLLLAFLQFSGDSETGPQPPLLDVDSSSISSLTLTDGEGNSAELTRTDSGWQLLSGLPADSAKVDGLLTKLAQLTTGWPVATNSSTHERFEVSVDRFQRRLVLAGSGADVTLLFGTSPGYQQVHARTASDSVYTVKLANFEMPAKVDDWLNKALLQPNGEVTAVNWKNGPTVTKEPQGWMLNGELADTAATEAALDRLAGFTVLGVLASAPNAAPVDAKIVLQSDADGDYRLSYWPREANNDHVAMSTRFPGEAFRISNFVAEQLQPSTADLEAPKIRELALPAVLQPGDAESEGTTPSAPQS